VIRRLLTCLALSISTVAGAAVLPAPAGAYAPPAPTFGPTTTTAVPASTFQGFGSIATGDLNGDGHDDVVAYTGNYVPTSSLAVWTSDTGTDPTSWAWHTLTPPTVAHLGDTALATAKLNANEDTLDIVALGESEEFGDSVLAIYPGNGDGTFGAPTEIAMPGVPNGLKVADVNGDGIPDLLFPTILEAGAEYEGAVVTLLGKGDGTFGSPIVSVVDKSASPYSVYVADLAVGNFTGSTNRDVAVAQAFYVPNEVHVLAGDGTGSFTPTGAPLQIASGSFALAGGDFTGDGKDDLAVPVDDADVEHPTEHWIETFLNQGAGAFSTVEHGGGTWTGNDPYSYTAEAVDLNGDGLADLVVPVASDLDKGTIQTMLSNGDGTFSGSEVPTGVNAIDATTGDFDGDGRPDVVGLVNDVAEQSLALIIADNTSEPSIELGVAALEFGEVEVGQTSDAAQVSITDTGNYGLTLESIALSGEDAADFHTIGCTPAPIAPGGSCKVEVTFAPSAARNARATLTVGSDDPLRRQATVALTGIGTPSSTGGGGEATEPGGGGSSEPGAATTEPGDRSSEPGGSTNSSAGTPQSGNPAGGPSTPQAAPADGSCPAATGAASPTAIGPARLGESAATIERAFHGSRSTRFAGGESFCLSPAGIAVGYPTPALLKALGSPGARYKGKVVWIATTNPAYTVAGVKVGEAAASAGRRLGRKAGHGWYLAADGPSVATFKVGGGKVTEVGLVVEALATGAARAALLASLEHSPPPSGN
jgi:hypothetical protein